MKRFLLFVLYVFVLFVSTYSLSFEYTSDTLSDVLSNAYSFFQKLSYEMPKESYSDISSYKNLVVCFSAKSITLLNSLNYNEVILGLESLAKEDSLDITNVDGKIKGTYSEVI